MLFSLLFVVFYYCFWNENYDDLIGIAITKSFSEYQCSIPKKSCTCTLISRIPLSDIGMDDLIVKSSHLWVYCTDIH